VRAATLVESLAELLDGPAHSFQLMGEDLALLPGARLRAAAASYEEALARIPASLRDPFEREQAAVLREAHGFLRKHNRTVHTRLAGYLEPGRRCDFEYPWPVVAMLGICQVLSGLHRNRLYGLFVPAAQRIGYPALAHLVEGTDDALRRTNRGIFADSVPLVLLVLHAQALRARGQAELAAALLEGPLPPVLDQESRALARGLFDGLAEPDRARRFAGLAALTLRHFGREQAIFTHHLGPRSARRRRDPPLLARLFALESVPAPVVEQGRRGRRVVFRPFALPPGFDVRDHAARVAAFGRAFVSSVTSDPDDYRAAVRYVIERFG